MSSKRSMSGNENFGASSMSQIDPEISNDIPSNNEILSEIACPQNALERWEILVLKLTQSNKSPMWDLWERAGILPKHARNLFDKVETRYGIHLKAEDRKEYYSKFYDRASGSTTLTASEMEQLLGPNESAIAESIEEARSQIQQLLAIFSASFGTVVECETDRLDFEFFLCCVCELLNKTVKPADLNVGSTQSKLARLFPIDPDSSMKQCWDIFCLVLLLYCSFSVPYSIAFLDNSSSSLDVMDIFGLAVDLVFMCDILLSFVTAIEVDGIVVRDLKVISATYCRSVKKALLYSVEIFLLYLHFHLWKATSFPSPTLSSPLVIYLCGFHA